MRQIEYADIQISRYSHIQILEYLNIECARPRARARYKGFFFIFFSVFYFFFNFFSVFYFFFNFLFFFQFFRARPRAR